MRPLAPLLLLLALLVGGGDAWAEDALPSPAPTDEERAEVRRIVDELRAEASRLRGLPWKREVPADLISRDQMVSYMEKEVAEEYTPEEIARDTRILRRLGLLGPTEDLVGMQLYMMREMVAGFFDPKADKLFLIAGVSAEAQRPAILHELIHALEHQHLDLEKRTRPLEEDPNRLFAEKCVEEGSAEHARLMYEKANPEVKKRSEMEQMTMENLKRQLLVLTRVPAYLIVSTVLQYDLGPKLVGRYVGEDYPGGMARLYEAPPTTEEQCLHPEKFLGERKDLEQKVVWGADLAAAAGGGWKKLHETSSGELDLGLFLDYHLGGNRGRVNPIGLGMGVWAAPVAVKAARGWDAGRDVFLEKEGLPLGWVSALAFDSGKDAEEAALALERALRAIGGDGFVGGAWSDVAPGVALLEYATPHGEGRLLRRGAQVIVVDGFPREALAAVWNAAVRTTFERDPADAVPAPE